MLDALNLVKGAVSDKDLVPALTHLAVNDGRIHGFNGRVHISTPCKELKGFCFTVPMVPFLAAIEACEGEPKIMLVEGTDKRMLTVRSAGDFLATIPYGDIQQFPIPDPSKAKKQKLKNLLQALAALRPFIGQDATRPWSASIKFQGCIAMATNNVILVEASLESLIPTMALPIFAVEELLRLGRDPTHMTVEPNAATFHYGTGEGLWLRTQLFEQPWPDAKAILKAAHEGSKQVKIPAGLLKAVQQVRPFCPDPKFPLIRLQSDPQNVVSTLDGETSASVGGLKGDPVGKGAYHADPLTAALSVALTADWGRFPKVPWVGRSGEVPLEGVLLGIPSL